MEKRVKEKLVKAVSGIKVTVEGQMALKGDRRTDVKKYEESFFLRAEHRKEALFLVRRFLIENRLEEKNDQYKFVRTCGIKAITIAEDIGVAALAKKKIEDMTPEEVRTYILIRGYPRDIMQDIPVNFDVVERLERYEAAPAKWGKKEGVLTKDKDDMPDGPVGGDGVAALKENWEDLDK